MRTAKFQRPFKTHSTHSEVVQAQSCNGVQTQVSSQVKATQSSQSSELYQLFCEGLKSRSAANSSYIFTSSPLEEEDEAPAAEQSPSAHKIGSKAKTKSKNQDHNFSTEVQIGSAECPPSRVPGCNTSDRRKCAKSPSNASHHNLEVNKVNQDQIHGEGMETRASDNDEYRGNRDDSPVDFVDHMIAVIRRDNAFAANSKGEIKGQDSSVLCKPRRTRSCSSKRKSIVASQESSETDFEEVNGAERKGPKLSKLSSGSVKNKVSSVSLNLVNHNSPIPSTMQQGSSSGIIHATDSETHRNNLPVITNSVLANPAPSVSNDRPSESSEDLLNLNKNHVVPKPRSSASSDGIRLRLSVSSSDHDSSASRNSNEAGNSETTDEETYVAARCRPFCKSPLNLNQKLTSVCLELSKNNQENSPVSKGSQERRHSLADNEKLGYKPAHLGPVVHLPEERSMPSKQPPRSALTSIPVVAAMESNIPGNSAPAVLLATASQNEKSKLSSILRDVVAYVEVRSGPDNRSRGVRVQLDALGAMTVDKFSNQVTHVVFNEGAPGVLKRAQEQGSHLVSVLWIDACKNAGQIVDESKYPPLNLHMYDPCNIVNRYRKIKSLQPDFDDDKCEERLNKHLRRIKRKAQRKVTQSQENKDGGAEPLLPSSQEVDGVRIPHGVKLKRLSIVVKKLAPNDSTSLSPTISSAKKQKKKLMPLQRLDLDCSSVEEFDPLDRITPQCPYVSSAQPKNKDVAPLRRSGRHSNSGDLESLKSGNPKHEGRIVRHRPSYESRRSSVFIPRKPKRIRKVRSVSRPKNKNQRCVMPTMVCTFMHRWEIDVVAAVIKQLGGWLLESTVSSRTTHVVCGDTKRTVNLLRGIAHGCWVLHQEWVLRSLEAGRWLDEEPFELNAFPAVRQCRIEREALGGRPDLFSSVGSVYVAEETSPPRDDLEELLQLCGAHVVKSARQARVIVGEHRLRNSSLSVTCVRELWVLDSIQENMLKPLKKYFVR